MTAGVDDCIMQAKETSSVISTGGLPKEAFKMLWLHRAIDDFCMFSPMIFMSAYQKLLTL